MNDKIPIFPLPLVLLPGEKLPLHIFEEKYKKMIEHCLKNNKKFGIINSGVILVILAFITTLIFGRFFCGWACHFGAIQELAWWLLNTMGIKPKTVNSSLVTIMPLFILLNFYIAPNLTHALNSPWEGITINLGMPEIWVFLPGSNTK